MQKYYFLIHTAKSLRKRASASTNYQTTKESQNLQQLFTVSQEVSDLPTGKPVPLHVLVPPGFDAIQGIPHLCPST